MNPFQPIDSTYRGLDLQPLSAQAVSLEPDEIQQAIDLSDRVQGEAKQWQTYLNAIARFGFERWLRERTVELPHPVIFNEIDNFYTLIKVGHFWVCLVAVEDLLDATIQIPTRFDRPEYTAHFYVVMEVLEEQGQVQIWGFLRHDQLHHNQWLYHQQTDLVSSQPEPTVAIPLTQFDANPEHLLLHLRCLEADAIPLSDRSLEPINHASHVSISSHPNAVSSLSRPIPQVMNLGRWLMQELDEVAEQFAWVLLPPLAFRSMRPMLNAANRSPLEELDAILAQINQTELPVPAQAHRGYQDLTALNENGVPLRLYAVVWDATVPTSDASPAEWTLLIILAASANQPLPDIQLQISDPSGVLVEQKPKQTADPYLYACVVGTWDEAFTVTIATPTIRLTLPAFVFQPGEA